MGVAETTGHRELLQTPAARQPGVSIASSWPVQALRAHWFFQEPLSYRLYRYPLILGALALIVGGKLGGLGSPQAALWWFGTCAVCLALALLALWCSLSRVPVALSVLAVFLFGGGYGARAVPPIGDELSNAATRKSVPIIARARIVKAAVWMPNPNYRPADSGSEPWRTRWDITIESVLDGDQWLPVNVQSRLLVDGRSERFLPGDSVEVHGSFRRIYPATNPGVFDLAEHHRKKSRFVLLTADSASQVVLLARSWSHPLARLRAIAVRQVDRTLRRRVSLGQSSLAAALVFGQREQVDWEEQQQLMATGTLHMLAISGMHVEMVALAVLIVCALLRTSDRTRLASVIAICGLYAALAGGKPPVLRAVILVGAYELAHCLGRKPRLVNLLSLAAIVLFLVHVANMENVGVHLSFLAVATIGIFVANRPRQRDEASDQLQTLVRESLSPVGRFLELSRRWFLSMLNLSFWVWLITCPLVWAHFHVVAPIAILLNVVIALPLGLSLLAGILTGALGWISPVGWTAGHVCGYGLALIAWLIEIGKGIPAGHVWLPAPPGWWIVCFYGIPVVWLGLFGRARLNLLAGILTLWIVLGVTLNAWGPRGFLGGVGEQATVETVPSESARDMAFTFLDVGHGTSVLIEMPNEEIWLYDAGHLGTGIRSHEEIAAALWELGTARIDTLIISHADADHYNAVRGLVARFAVRRIVSTPHFWASPDRDVRQLIEELQLHGIVTETWAAGTMVFPIANGAKEENANPQGLRIRVLHPQNDFRAASDNASSLCVLFEYQGKRVLLPGDLEGHGLLNLVELPARPCHVLMAPHHGSLAVDPADLLQWCRPELIVVSGNHRANRDVVKQMYSLPGVTLGVTFRDGAVRYGIGEDGTTVEHWNVDGWEKLAAIE